MITTLKGTADNNTTKVINVGDSPYNQVNEVPALQEFPGVIDFKHFLSFTWTLRFKRGQTFHTKNFYFEGTMTDAKCRAYAHCGAMDYTFINIARFIVDLDHQEEYKKRAGVYQEDSL